MQGPSFLFSDAVEWPSESHEIQVPSDDPEVKKIESSEDQVSETCCAQQVPDHCIIDSLFRRYSSWYWLKRAVAILKRFMRWWKSKRQSDVSSAVSVDEIRQAEEALLRFDQERYFKQELKALMSNASVLRSSSVFRLEPFLDEKGVIRVGGRLANADQLEQAQNQVLLSDKSYIAMLIVRYVHERECRHSGTEMVLAFVRQSFWITKARRVIKSVLHNCVVCKLLYARARPQRMADLPHDRVNPSPAPFRSVGIDCFGPFYVKRGRVTEKRYGCIFTCLAVRAIHIEVLASLDADSLINAIIRFSARRGQPDVIRCDNGTNFVGSSRELSASVDEWNRRVNETLVQKNIEWKFNTPSASHHGGVWERQIRSVRRVMNAIVRNTILDDERLLTVFCEVESIINSRPITRSSDCPGDAEPLTPNHLLLVHQRQRLPPGVFSMKDIYTRRWRHAQHLVNRFWLRWMREYVANIQHRQKWIQALENIKVGDIVLLVDEQSPRNRWPMGRVVDVFTGRDGLVRSASVKTQSNTLKRPVTKLCLLEGATQ